ncbi:MAG: aminoglycoside phosphotransferase family protein [Bacteroidales bacterium]
MPDPSLLLISQVFKEFQTNTRFVSARRIGTGHINDTYKIETHTPNLSFVLQRINSSVFKDIPGLMKNIEIITQHIENKIISGDPDATSFSMLKLISTNNQKSIFYDEFGDYWRLYNFIEGTESIDVVENTELAYKGGKAFGLFQQLTSDIPIEILKETIPLFHDVDMRLERFYKTIHEDPEDRVKKLSREIRFVKEREMEMKTIKNLVKEGKIPIRVTHNDTKFNNILFDRDKNAVCVVDLDTVMPGSILYDFGDAIRTGVNRVNEDEKDLEKVGIELNLFRAYSEGYLEQAGKILNKAEISHLAFSAKYMTYLIGLRFLTDYLDGDHYYRIKHPNHNLQRARSQFRFLESMEEEFDQMKRIISDIAQKKLTI